MEPAFQAKGVALRVELGDALPLVWADAEKLHQVLVNLFANAIAATSEGGTVTISAGSRAATPEEIEVGFRVGNATFTTMVTIVVSDTGSGMPEEDLQKAFTPFFTTKAIGKGTGLGLFISRETVQAHGGTLTLESEVGKGTTVVISLPGQSAAATSLI
jgi:signal transduction histidine kinase